MVTRRTRNFKEKSTASNILGRLIMPVAVVMALALFYFSIKLFFFSPPREEQQRGTAPAAEHGQSSGGYGAL